MRKLIILVAVFSYLFSGASIATYVIPAGGQSISLDPLQIPTTLIVNAAPTTNLGANPYTIASSFVPQIGNPVLVNLDVTNLTYTAGSQITIFGVQPLVDYPYLKSLWIQFYVNNAGALIHFYISPPFTSGTVSALTVTGTTNLYGPTYVQNLFKHPFSADSTSIRIVSDSSIDKGCTQWCDKGNPGTNSGTNYVGTTDTASLVFRVDGVQGGLIQMNGNGGNTAFGHQALLADAGTHNTGIGFSSLFQNTSGSENTGEGYKTLYANTTGNDNTAVGLSALLSSTTASYNTAIGASALASSITGASNTAVGQSALDDNTTGSFNTAIGRGAGVVNTTGTLNTYLGYQADATTNNFSNATGLGANALVLGSNRLDISPAVKVIGLTGHTTGIGWALKDSSGNGDFIPMPDFNTQTYFTPVTGDSVAVATKANIVNNAGTIANFTLILPGSPVNGQVLEFSFTHVVTTLHWSTAANQSNAVHATVPAAATAGGVLSIQFNTATGTWYNY